MKARISSATILRAAATCALAVAILGTTGCSWFHKKKKKDAEVQMTVPTPSTGTDAHPISDPPGYQQIESLEPVPTDSMSVIYFDYNTAKLRDDQMARLEKNIKFLHTQKDAKILVEGNCDERGSTEYNYALGEQRARAVADYYIAGGIAADHLRVGSKGEDAPADAGHTEKAWAKNRRAEFYYIRLKK